MPFADDRREPKRGRAIVEAFYRQTRAIFRDDKITTHYIGLDANSNAVYSFTRTLPAGEFTDTGKKVLTTTWAWNGRTLLPPAKISRVTDPSTAQPQPQGPQVDQNARNLETLRTRALNWIGQNSHLMSARQRQAWASQARRINDFGRLNQWFGMIQQELPLDRGVHAEFVPDEPAFDPFAGFGGGGGGGGGGGFAGPQYVAPDRRVVEDTVTGELVNLVGEIPDSEMVKELTDVYMKEHRRDFDTLDEQIDPAQSVIERIRKTEEYQRVHNLRPDSQDERRWIADRRAAAARGGLATGLQEEFAIQQATVGGDLEAVQRAGGVQQFRVSGSTRGTELENQMRDTIQHVFRGVV